SRLHEQPTVCLSRVLVCKVHPRRKSPIAVLSRLPERVHDRRGREYPRGFCLYPSRSINSDDHIRGWLRTKTCESPESIPRNEDWDLCPASATSPPACTRGTCFGWCRPCSDAAARRFLRALQAENGQDDRNPPGS